MFMQNMCRTRSWAKNQNFKTNYTSQSSQLWKGSELWCIFRRVRQVNTEFSEQPARWTSLIPLTALHQPFWNNTVPTQPLQMKHNDAGFTSKRWKRADIQKAVKVGRTAAARLLRWESLPVVEPSANYLLIFINFPELPFKLNWFGLRRNNTGQSHVSHNL